MSDRSDQDRHRESPGLEPIEIGCPSCGEVNEVQLERASWGVMVQDCWVCCRPIEIDVRWDEWGDPVVKVELAE